MLKLLIITCRNRDVLQAHTYVDFTEKPDKPANPQHTMVQHHGFIVNHILMLVLVCTIGLRLKTERTWQFPSEVMLRECLGTLVKH